MAISSARSTNENSKSALAAKIFDEMASAKESYTRKQIIDRFVAEAKLTPAGAATYYYNLSKKMKVAGSDVVPETPVAAQPQRPTRRSK